jgi:aminoglycoside 2'-N-acetyltransferase I
MFRTTTVRQTVSMAAIARFTTADATREYLGQIRRLFFAAFDETFTEQDWGHCLGGWHVVVIDGGVVIAHAAVVPRVLEVADRPFRTGYVEGVATDPARQREGLGSQTMRQVAQLLRSEFEMGALSTGVHDFYERLGWKRWLGPTYVRHGSELVRTEEEDAGVMALPFGPSQDIDLTTSISCRSRSGDDW